MEKEKRITEHSTFRIDKDILENLKAVSKEEKLSLNTYVNQILDSHINWDVSAAQVGWVVMLKSALVDLVKGLDSETIVKTSIKAAESGAKEIALYMRGKYGIDEWISIIRDRAKMSGFNFKEYEENNKIILVMHHDMDQNWSLFFKTYYEKVFDDLGIPVKTDFTENSIVIELDRGTD
jgi:hypothetical protein